MKGYSPVRAVITLWLIRQGFRALGWLLALAAAAALWPLVAVSAAAFTAAWSLGWPPARLYRAALWSLTMTGVYLTAAALQAATWQDIAMTPARDWLKASRYLLHASIAPALLTVAPVAVPAGLAAGGALWAWRTRAVSSGLAGRSAFAPAAFDARQWRRQARGARGAVSAPGAIPLATRNGTVPAGAVIRVIRRRWTPVLTIPAADFTRHMVIVGATGTGKTNLMIRLWAGWHAAAQQAARTGKPRPLLCALDCKGGPDARAKAKRTSRVLRGAGARRVAIWPDEAALSLWDIPPRDLAVLLHQMIETGDGAAAYYADITQAVLTLALCAPGSPPATAREFLDRLTPAWLQAAYAEARPAELTAIRAARPHLGDIQLRYTTLLSRLGPALDGPGHLTDADAWYFILEGTREPSVAEAQAMAITELIAHAATATGTEPRTILLAADDYSAVSRRVPLSNLCERGRSLGLGVMVSAQSWQGLGADDDERNRIAATADGGLWLMRTPYPEPLVSLAGTRRTLESARKILGPAFGDEGTSRIQHAWTADPDIIRQLDTGQACYIHHGTAAYIQVARPRPSPLTLPAAPRPVIIPPPPAPAPETGNGHPGQHQPGNAPSRLDDVLGPRPGAAP
jgi:hypothetical protein